MASPTAIPIFPGHTLKSGVSDKQSTLVVQHRLNQLNLGPIAEDGIFGAETEEAVEVFQGRSVDTTGTPLTVDGQVGPNTWAALFGKAALPPVTPPATPLLAAVLTFAGTQVGKMEVPPGSNRGPEVNQYLRSVGVDPGNPWCAAFVYFCFDQSARSLNVANPVPKTGSVLDMWGKAGKANLRRVTPTQATDTPSLVRPGMAFLLRFKNGTGHTGLIEAVDGDRLTTIEGNSNEGGSREGVGVFRRTGRTIGSTSLGFIDFSATMS